VSAKPQPAYDVRTEPALWFLGVLTLVKGPQEQRAGEFGVLEQTSPAGFECPYHVHELEDQAFYIIQGEMTFVVDGKWRRLGPGGYIFLPRNLPHGFRVDGSTPARYLVVCSPAGFERFFFDVSVPAGQPGPSEGGDLDLPKLLELGKRHKVKMVGPLPQPPPDFAATPSSDQALIEAIRTNYLKAFNGRDLKALRTLFTDNAIQMPPNQATNFGITAIGEWAQQLFRMPRLHVAISPGTVEVSADRAVETGEFTVEMIPEGSKKDFRNHGKYLRVYQRLSVGGWAISHDIWNRDLPA
jgi:ketosteroid isomerase-like protein/quercetin dioxygenase-like cupin family protein